MKKTLSFDAAQQRWLLEVTEGDGYRARTFDALHLPHPDEIDRIAKTLAKQIKDANDAA